MCDLATMDKYVELVKFKEAIESNECVCDVSGRYHNYKVYTKNKEFEKILKTMKEDIMLWQRQYGDAVRKMEEELRRLKSNKSFGDFLFRS